MSEVFRKYITEKAALTDNELELVMAASKTKKLRKKQYILQEGEVCRFNTFISRGCLRMYRIGEEGLEHILRFAIENWWISDRESIRTGQPSQCNIDALEDSEVIQWKKTDMDELLNTIPGLKSWSEQLLSKSFDANMNRVYTNIGYSAEERYQHFLKTYPNIFNRVPLHMIASYLGVSPKTLTRIRIQLAHE